MYRKLRIFTSPDKRRMFLIRDSILQLGPHVATSICSDCGCQYSTCSSANKINICLYQCMGIEWLFTPHICLIRGKSFSSEIESYNADHIATCIGLICRCQDFPCPSANKISICLFQCTGIEWPILFLS